MAKWRSGEVISVWLSSAWLLAGCATWTGQRPDVTPEVTAAPLVWPAPPQEPRIQFLRAVAQPQDLGIRRGFWRSAVAWLAGRSQAEQLVRPTGVAAAGAMLYVADPGAPALWVFDTQAHRAQRLQRAGRQRLASPVAVAIGPRDGVFLVDSYLAAVFVYDAKGALTAAITTPEFQRPAGVAYDASRDRLYVADSQAHQVWVLTGAGAPVGAIGRRGEANGEFNFPTHVAVDRRDGTLYVTDALGFRVQRFAPEGRWLGTVGHHGDGSGDFASPKGLAVDRQGHLYVADALFDAVQLFELSGRLLLTLGGRGRGPGEFWMPNGLWIDEQDRIYVADAYNQRIQIFGYLSGGVGAAELSAGR